MRRLFLANRQLLPSLGWVLAYWLTAMTLILLVSFGLSSAGGEMGWLWGVRLGGFGHDSQDFLNSAYLEFVYHVWMVVALPFICFVGVQPLLRSFRNDFRQFLRYSRSSRLFVESARIIALAVVIVVTSLPFVVAVVWGRIRPGLDCTAMLDGAASCAGALLFVGILTYLLAALAVPGEIATCLGFVAPFFMSGILLVLTRHEQGSLVNYLPSGLPYYVTYTDPNLRASAAFAAVVVVVRLVCAARTCWLTVAPSGACQGS